MKPNFDLFAETPFPVVEKTIRQLWEGTPHGKAITDIGYLKLCCAADRLAMSIKEVDSMLGVWDDTPAEAGRKLAEWEKRETRRNPDFVKERKEAQFRAFIAD